MTRLCELDKPFILLLPVHSVCTRFVKTLFKNRLQIIIPNTRIHYESKDDNGNIRTLKRTSFDSVYVCYKMNLPRDMLWLWRARVLGVLGVLGEFPRTIFTRIFHENGEAGFWGGSGGSAKNFTQIFTRIFTQNMGGKFSKFWSLFTAIFDTRPDPPKISTFGHFFSKAWKNWFFGGAHKLDGEAHYIIIMGRTRSHVFVFEYVLLKKGLEG